MTDHEEHSYDVLIIGAGGAGLRAAIAAREAGMRTAIICKSLFGKAHTVMAEGGIAASMGNVNSKDSWQVHFRDTMRGGKFLNNPRMAELHAKEAPDRVWELETYGALFDRTPDGRISQRNFGGHEYPRLAHVGDRTGLELIRTLQQKIVSLRQDEDSRRSVPRAPAIGDDDAGLRVFAEVTITELLTDDAGAIAGAFGYRRETGKFVIFRAPAVILATGGIGKSFKVTSNSWEYTGDGHALALRAGSTLVNMEFVQFHPTGMVWPPSVKGILVTESVRGDGGVLRNSEGTRFMFNYVPEVFRAKYAETEEEADGWYKDSEKNRRPPDLLPRDEVARAINSEVKAGRGTEHGGVFLDVSTRLPAEEIKRRLPSMHHQFSELADVDITKVPMEVGPTCHYVMGGVEVDPDTAAAARVPGPLRGRRGVRRHARLQPARRQFAVRPAGLRPPGGARRRRLRRGRSAAPSRRRSAGSIEAAAERALAPFQPPADGGRREPVHPAPRTAAGDERPGRHHPQGGGDPAGAGRDRRAQAAGRRGQRGGPPAVQPGLAPGAGPGEHAAGQRMRRPGRVDPAGEPRRAHPRRLSGDERAVAATAADLRGSTATGMTRRSPSSRSPRSGPTCWPCSSGPSWRSTSPRKSCPAAGGPNDTHDQAPTTDTASTEVEP